MDPPLDLSSCATEPIHLLGAVQPHGVLLAVTEPELVVVQASESAGAWLGRSAESIVGERLDRLLDDETRAVVDRARAAPSLREQNPLPAIVCGASFAAILHRSGDLLVIELEPEDASALRSPAELAAIHARARSAVLRLEAVASLAELWSTTAALVRKLSGFDRVMVYRLSEEDGSGEVIAEAKADDLEPFLGLHYPATDVPEQARRLYVRSRLRLICDVSARASPLVPATRPGGEPLDLGAAVLRSVSAVHIEYLENMGVRASMSISIVEDARLVGLVACHHRSPRRIPYPVRLICELVGDVVSWMRAPRFAREDTQRRVEAARVERRLVARLTSVPEVASALTSGSPDALALVDATGLAVAQEGRVVTLGRTPPGPVLEDVVAWLDASAADSTFATDELERQVPAAAAHPDVAAGLLAIRVGNALGLHVLWFRPEQPREVRWGGDPSKPAAVVSGRLSPRRSFAAWIEHVRGRSAPWATWEIEAATDLGAALTGFVVNQAGEVLKLNQELGHALRSRDRFLSMASHELKTPVTTLRLHLEWLRRAAGRETPPPPEVVRPRVEACERQAERLALLVDRMLDVARWQEGRLALERTRFDFADLVREVAARHDVGGSPVVVRVAPGDFVGSWDRLRMDQVLTNLLSNAVKYGEGRPVEVDLGATEATIRCAVRDEGIGVSAEAQQRVFERFERGVSAAHFAGVGLGLWVVRTIVELHGGRVWLESREGHGATFTFEVPRGAEGPR
jgi:light-regulated signal transduction histidine kinase (bacteriophytochrome)